jgi:hypothetical protein
MAEPGDLGHLDDHNKWSAFIDDVVNKRIFPGPEGPQGPVGPVGPMGPDGQGLKIDGFYDTFEEFIQAHPIGQPGDAYIVNVDLLLWNPKSNSWLNTGPVQGPVGPAGPGNTLTIGSVQTTDGDASATITGVSPDQVLSLEIPRGIQGAQGEKGDKGDKGDRGDPGVPGVVKGTSPIHVDDLTDTVSLDVDELNVIQKPTLDITYAAKADLEAKANLDGADFTGTVNVVSPVAPNSSGVRQTFISSEAPSSSDGKDGDIWMVYTQ